MHVISHLFSVIGLQNSFFSIQHSILYHAERLPLRSSEAKVCCRFRLWFYVSSRFKANARLLKIAHSGTIGYLSVPIGEADLWSVCSLVQLWYAATRRGGVRLRPPRFFVRPRNCPQKRALMEYVPLNLRNVRENSHIAHRVGISNPEPQTLTIKPGAEKVQACSVVVSWERRAPARPDILIRSRTPRFKNG